MYKRQHIGFGSNHIVNQDDSDFGASLLLLLLLLLIFLFYHTGYHPGLHPGVILGVCRPRARKNRHPTVILALRFELPASTVTAQSSWYHPGRRLGGPCLLSLHVLLSVIRLSQELFLNCWERLPFYRVISVLAGAISSLQIRVLYYR